MTAIIKAVITRHMTATAKVITHLGTIKVLVLVIALPGTIKALVLVHHGTIAVQATIHLGITAVLVLTHPGTITGPVLAVHGTIEDQVLVHPGIMEAGVMVAVIHLAQEALING